MYPSLFVFKLIEPVFVLLRLLPSCVALTSTIQSIVCPIYSVWTCRILRGLRCSLNALLKIGLSFSTVQCSMFKRD